MSMSEGDVMFEAIKNRIAERSRAFVDLQADLGQFKADVSVALRDAAPAPDNFTSAALVAGVTAVVTQMNEATDQNTMLKDQRAKAYDAERKATARVDELEREKLEIAALLDLVPADPEPDNSGGQTDSEIAAEQEGQAMINVPADAAT